MSELSQEHHISYDPEITIDILKGLHEEFHGHGTGRATGQRGNPSKPFTKNHLGLRIGFVGLKMRDNLIYLIDQTVKKGELYGSRSDFIRSAIREKIQRDYPELMRTLFEE